ncbi:uncharacterized protein LOC133657009 isoform X1 [Entelurus aequoreus]|uniref:uncharacterized protein LOC133657009 isoform X1 n=1 Tax=Entelurus aequoreus TaxID=161455 RepID=UPI002B1D25E2|nr:uncharacterized protein LOC133657009 isoform X1 [Entelurus aequoreus]
MWTRPLVASFYLAALVTSQRMECREDYDFPPTSDYSPSVLADLKVELVKVSGEDMMNVSWAINIDGSIEYLKGTRLVGETVVVCEYTPPLAQVDMAGSHQKWFHYLVRAKYGSNVITAANLPLPPQGSGLSYKYRSIIIPRPKHSFAGRAPKTTIYPKADITDITTDSPRSADPPHTLANILLIIYSGLAAVMILTSGYILYKRCWRRVALLLGLKRLPPSFKVPVSVLLVYPPEDGAFQKAVMALAEFLQKHASCSVAIDVWQQARIAQLGPLRWLAEEVKAAQRVLIICPQSGHPAPSNLISIGPCVPAAAHDLYPLTLNTVASHAKNADELSKFWVLQLGQHHDKRPGSLAPELRACRRFCLLRDLSKLCRSLHTRRRDGKMWADFIFVADSEKSTVKLKDAVEKLSVVIPAEAQPLNSVIAV